jgi:4-oxalomesaconate tautomerase
MKHQVKCMWMRGGTSKGAYFLASDMPTDVVERDALLLRLMGSPDVRQIDGLGGADALTSKIAIVSRSQTDDADVDFLFAQVGIDKALVDTKPNCGNILAGVGPFAIERGLITPTTPETRVRIRTINTGTLVEAVIQTPNGEVQDEGVVAIDGVPGTAAPIAINFLDASGSVCGSLLPTGNKADVICGICVTCIDNGMPVVVMAARDLGCTGYESCAELEGNKTLRRRLEEIRLEAGPKMGLGDVTFGVIPKMVLVAEAQNGGVISTRSFLPHKCHEAIGVFGAVSVATACVLPGSSCHALSKIPPGRNKRMKLEHPTGDFEVVLEVGGTGEAPAVERVGVLRTARVLMDGMSRVPSDIARFLPTEKLEKNKNG